MRPNKKWLFTKYDAFNRPVMTGVYTNTTSLTREQVQSVVETFYSNSNNKYYEETGSAILGYTNQSFPSTTAESLLTITYYDGYQQLTTANGFGTLGFLASGIIAFCDNDGNTNGYHDSVRGQVTGTRVKVLDGNEHTANAKWLATATYYDDRYRPIQTRGTLYDGATGGIFTTSTRYRFNGLVEQVAESQTLNSVTTERNTFMIYDHAGRLTKKEQQITGDASNGRVAIAEMTYNELGQLQQKKLGGNIQSVDYKYNIRGWLTRINDPDNLGADLFGMKLLYNDTDASLGGTAQYNGNISATVWKTQSKKKRAYSYSYDELSRLLSSNHKVYSTTWGDSTSYEEKNISYDKNGNITHLLRTNQTGGTLNDFTYTYNETKLKHFQKPELTQAK
ncbi:MAG: hypothetical protein HOO91_07120 [Bacteroidales bacterium]|nr:hypothetical protein [Bacteroidales bacterium]